MWYSKPYVNYDALLLTRSLLSRLSSSKHLAVELGLELHRHELLEKQLARIRNLDLADVFAGVAGLAVVLELV